MQRWTPQEIVETIQMALHRTSRVEEAKERARKLADRVSTATPKYPLTASVAEYALGVVAGAIDGSTYGASDELLRQLDELRHRVC